MNKYLLACVAALFMFSACEKKSSTDSGAENSAIQEAEKWGTVENKLGVDPLNEDAVDDAKALSENTTPQKEQQEDHWNDGVWTDDENNESLNAQERIMKDSIEKVREDSNKSGISQEDKPKEPEATTPRPGTQEPRDWNGHQQTSYDPGVDPLDDEDAEEHDGILYSKLNEANDTPDEWTQEEDSKSHEIAEKTMPLESGIEKNKEAIQEQKKIGVAD